MADPKIILVTGATGRQGGATVRHLLAKNRKVRLFTRNLENPILAGFKNMGAEVYQGDFDDTDSLKKALDGVYGVFSVQNPWVTSLEKEVEHGIRIATLAKEAGVGHFVYSSAGTGTGDTGVPHFNTKWKIEKHIESLQIPFTILRPVGFMELMSEKDFVPPLVAWNVVEKIIGKTTPLYWVAVDDIGKAAATVFDHPETYIGKSLPVAGDRKSIGDCREIYTSVYGKKPFRIPAPVWLFKLMQNDLWLMFHWMLKGEEPDDLVEQTQTFIGEVTTLQQWMEGKK